ncbi:DUF4399 domain-containing protein [Candidatus Acetothermia bacterium]|nr:DUF4399 domain-containing protein [Candidatus Acetothermia bacterium]
MKRISSLVFFALLSLFVSSLALAHGKAETTAPQVLIAGPSNGQVISGSEITVDLIATGVTIQKADGQHVDGIAHFHLFLGTEEMTPKAGEPLGKDWVHTAETKYTFKDVKPGKYVLTVVLADGKHVPLEGATAKATVQFATEASVGQPPPATETKKEEHTMEQGKKMDEKMMQMHNQHTMLLVIGLLLVAAVAVYVFFFNK